jgi:mannose-6-phosphate isomerase
MACSDNVVRAGLTPKLRDTDVLLSMLTYAEHTGRSALMQPSERLGKGLTEFAPSKEFSEFRLVRAELSPDTRTSLVLPPSKQPSIMLVFAGEGTAALVSTSVAAPSSAPLQPLRRGDVLLVPAGASVQLVQTSAGGVAHPLLVFQCTANDEQQA